MPILDKNIDRYLTWGAFKVGSMLCKSMALCMGLCNIFCFRIWLAVRIQSRRAWLVAWGLTEWTMVKWGTSSKTWTDVLQRGHEVFSKGTLNRCHSWNDKKKSLIFSEKLNGQGCRTNRMFIGQIFTKVIKKSIAKGIWSVFLRHA